MGHPNILGLRERNGYPLSAHIEGASLENVAFGRRIISTGTNVLTLPGMWVLAITGAWMGYKRYGLRQRFVQLKLLLITLVVLNAHFFIAPAVNSATDLAVRSLAQGSSIQSTRRRTCGSPSLGH